MGRLVTTPPLRRSEPFGAPRPPSPAVRRPSGGLPEPPAFKVPVPGSPMACASCSVPVPTKTSPPFCWGCGRRLCADCYWRHGLTLATHRCASCLARPRGGGVAISGGRSASRAGFSGRV
jgi:hypothetical protein